MKKYICVFTAVLALLAGCKKPADPVVQDDAVSVTPSEADLLPSTGGDVTAIVTSTGAWTLDAPEGCDWVVASSYEGVNGDPVIFLVDPNESEVQKDAEFTFNCGTASAKFTVSVAAADAPVISLDYEEASAVIPAEGGELSVLVRINKEAWTLKAASEYDWVHPSAETGANLAVVRFKVDANSGKEDRTANYEFICGSATATLEITGKAAEIKVYTLERASDEALILSCDRKDDFTVLFNTNAEYKDVTAESSQSWIRYDLSSAGDDEGRNAKLFFVVDNYIGTTPRTATITVKASPADAETPITTTFDVVQRPQSTLAVEFDEYYVAPDGGEIEIKLNTNIECEVTVPESASWLTFTGIEDGKAKFTAAASATGTTTEVTFTENNPPIGATAVTAKTKVTVKTSSLIEYVADMTGVGAALKAKAAKLNGLTKFTIELLINADDLKSGSEISTLLGVEGSFLLRFGDGVTRDRSNCLQVSTSGTSLWPQYLKIPITHHKMWLRLAVTFDAGRVQTYFEGKSGGAAGNTGLSSVNFGIPVNSPATENIYGRGFWVGYSYTSGREFNGKMSEVRIWNRVLSLDEMNAANHQYYVDPATAEGLVAYWKFNDGQGDTVKDHSGNGYDLKFWGTPKWVPVSLP